MRAGTARDRTSGLKLQVARWGAGPGLGTPGPAAELDHPSTR